MIAGLHAYSWHRRISHSRAYHVSAFCCRDDSCARPKGHATAFRRTRRNFAGLLCAHCEPMLFAPLYIWDTCLSALILTCGNCGRPQSSAQGQIRPCGRRRAHSLCSSIRHSSPVLFAIAAGRPGGRGPFRGLASWHFWSSSPRGLFATRRDAFLHPPSTNFGYEFWQGNHEEADGENPPCLGLPE